MCVHPVVVGATSDEVGGDRRSGADDGPQFVDIEIPSDPIALVDPYMSIIRRIEPDHGPA